MLKWRETVTEGIEKAPSDFLAMFKGKNFGKPLVKLVLTGKSPHTSRTHSRSQRWAGSASSCGCQSNETVNSGVGNGSGKLNIPERGLPIWRSGTLAIKPEARASGDAVEKPATPKSCSTVTGETGTEEQRNRILPESVE